MSHKNYEVHRYQVAEGRTIKALKHGTEQELIDSCKKDIDGDFGFVKTKSGSTILVIEEDCPGTCHKAQRKMDKMTAKMKEMEEENSDLRVMLQLESALLANLKEKAKIMEHMAKLRDMISLFLKDNTRKYRILRDLLHGLNAKFHPIKISKKPKLTEMQLAKLAKWNAISDEQYNACLNALDFSWYNKS